VGLAPPPLARPLGLLASGPLRSKWVVTRARPLASRPPVLDDPDQRRRSGACVVMHVIAAIIVVFIASVDRIGKCRSNPD
jgi:hypothetical protein